MTMDRNANWLEVVGQGLYLEQIAAKWPKLVDTDELRDTPPIEVLPFPGEITDEMKACGFDPILIAKIDHAPSVGHTLLNHLRTEFKDDLSIPDGRVVIQHGYYLSVD